MIGERFALVIVPAAAAGAVNAAVRDGATLPGGVVVEPLDPSGRTRLDTPFSSDGSAVTHYGSASWFGAYTADVVLPAFLPAVGGRSWSVAARDLGASPGAVGAFVAAALADAKLVPLTAKA